MAKIKRTIRVGDTIINEGRIDTVVEVLDTESFPYKTKSGLLFSKGGSKILTRPLGNFLKDFEESKRTDEVKDTSFEKFKGKQIQRFCIKNHENPNHIKAALTPFEEELLLRLYVEENLHGSLDKRPSKKEQNTEI